jgi:hypothetical protein
MALTTNEHRIRTSATVVVALTVGYTKVILAVMDVTKQTAMKMIMVTVYQVPVDEACNVLGLQLATAPLL